MKLKRNNFIKISALGLLSLLTISGCGITDMSEAQTKVIAEYAADVLIHYDASYYDMFAEEPKIKDKTETADNTSDVESSQPTVMPKIEPTAEPEPVNLENVPSEPTGEAIEDEKTNTQDEQQQKVVPLEVGKIFGLENVEISYKSSSIVDKYPESDQPVFQMDASEGHKLLVITLNLLNLSDQTSNCNILGQNIKFRVCINDSDYLSVQKTLLTDDLSQLNITLQPEESRDAVVVCQVPNDYNPEISSLSLIVRTGGEDKVVKFK